MTKTHFPNSEYLPVRRKRCSVTKLCPTHCDSIDCSTSGFPVILCLPKFAQIHVDLVMLSIHPILCHLFSSCPQSFPPFGFVPMTRLLTSGGQSIRASASASVLPMNIQGRSLGLTGLISLLSKELSRVFSSTTIRKHQFFSTRPS